MTPAPRQPLVPLPGRLIAWTFALLLAAALGAPPADAFQFLAKWGTTGSGDGQLAQPFDLAVNPDTGSQYVADHDNNRIVQFDPNGGFVRSWGGLGAGDAQFNEPNGVGLDGQGNLWVADNVNNRIKKFDATGGLLAVFGTSGTTPGQLSGPDDVAVDAGGSFYVVEQGMNRVQKFAPDGAFLTTWPVGNGPTGIAVGGSSVYVVSYNASTGARFDLDGKSLGGFGGPGTGAGQFSQPWHLGVSPLGGFYVADRANDRVQAFDAAGGFVNAFGWGVASGAAAFEICTTSCQAGLFGAGDGQFGSPGGVGVDCRGSVYVVEQAGRVQKFGEPGTRNPPCPSNDFRFGKVKRNKRKGTASLAVILPGPGTLALAGKGLKPEKPGKPGAGAAVISRTVAAAGKVKLLVKTKGGKKRRRLNRTGKVKVAPKITYTPTNGDPNAKTRRIKLVKSR